MRFLAIPIHYESIGLVTFFNVFELNEEKKRRKAKIQILLYIPHIHAHIKYSFAL